MTSQEQPCLSMVFVSIVDFDKPFADLSERRQKLMTVTSQKLREIIPVSKIFTATNKSARQAAEIMEKIYNWDMEIEGAELLGKPTTRLLIITDAYKIKDVLSQRYDHSDSGLKAVVCIAEQAVIAGALNSLTGVALDPRMVELDTGEAIIVHFNTRKWSDLNPFTVMEAEVVQPWAEPSPEMHWRFEPK